MLSQGPIPQFLPNPQRSANIKTDAGVYHSEAHPQSSTSIRYLIDTLDERRDRNLSISSIDLGHGQKSHLEGYDTGLGPHLMAYGVMPMPAPGREGMSMSRRVSDSDVETASVASSARDYIPYDNISPPLPTTSSSTTTCGMTTSAIYSSTGGYSAHSEFPFFARPHNETSGSSTPLSSLRPSSATPMPTINYPRIPSLEMRMPQPPTASFRSISYSASIQPTGSSRSPISRTTKACNACRSRKVRCDAGGASAKQGQVAPCSRCIDAGLGCEYSLVQRRRGPAPGTTRGGSTGGRKVSSRSPSGSSHPYEYRSDTLPTPPIYAYGAHLNAPMLEHRSYSQPMPELRHRQSYEDMAYQPVSRTPSGSGVPPPPLRHSPTAPLSQEYPSSSHRDFRSFSYPSSGFAHPTRSHKFAPFQQSTSAHEQRPHHHPVPSSRASSYSSQTHAPSPYGDISRSNSYDHGYEVEPRSRRDPHGSLSGVFLSANDAFPPGDSLSLPPLRMLDRPIEG